MYGRVLSGDFVLAKVVVHATEGVVQKFIGDAATAVPGAPVTLEDDAERAVRAGLESVSARLRRTAALPASSSRRGLAWRRGAWRQLNGPEKGPSLMTASRLLGAIQGPYSTARVLLRRRCDEAAPGGAPSLSTDAGSHALKGKSAPEQLFRAVRVTSGAGGHQRPEGPEAPLIGRDVELHALKSSSM